MITTKESAGIQNINKLGHLPGAGTRPKALGRKGLRSMVMVSSKLQITVRPFAMLRELLGLHEDETVRIVLQTGSRSDELLVALLAQHPILTPYGNHLLMAREGQYLEATTLLEDGDLISLYPPLSGG